MSCPRSNFDDDEYKMTSTRNTFSPNEDTKMLHLVELSGRRPQWKDIAQKLYGKTPRQCRERYNNYLNPNLQHEQWSQEEDQIILDKHRELGNHWMAISRCLKGRTGNSVRNRFNILERRNVKAHMDKYNDEKINTLVTNEESDKMQLQTVINEIAMKEIFDKIFENQTNGALLGGSAMDYDLFGFI